MQFVIAAGAPLIFVIIAGTMRFTCGLLAATLALAPVLAVAQPPQEIAAVQQLYGEGRDLYETADYDGAIAKWTQAYSMLGDEAESADIKTTLLYNLASAHEEAFGIDGDITHLTKAKVLLERFEQSVDELYEGEAIETERQRVLRGIARIDEKLRAAQGEPEPEPEPKPADAPAVEPNPEPNSQVVERPEPRAREGKPLIIAGSVLTGLGVAGLGLGVWATLAANSANTFDDAALGLTPEALELRHDQIRQGQQMNALTYAGFIAGGVLTVVGVTLIGLTIRKKAGLRAAIHPALDPTHAGLIVRGSF